MGQLKDKFRGLFGEEWYNELQELLESNYWLRLGNKIATDRKVKTIYPEKHSNLLFKAFRTTPLSKVKVVILGQDPYHDGSYDGFAFSNSTKQLGRISPSLANIFKEVEDDVYNGLKLEQNPDLERWAEQGVLLINTAHTVVKSNPGWYLKDWMPFTQETVNILTLKKQPIVWMLWGRHARDMVSKTNKDHLYLESPHPSPFSAHTGFFGNKHFSKCNKYLEEHDRTIIQW